MNYIAQPLSRKQLRNMAKQIRQHIGCENTLQFPVILFLEHVMPLLFTDFYYDIIPKQVFEANRHADTDVTHKCIRIREDVYYGALKGWGRDRMTVAHEIAHYILLVVHGVKFERTFDKTIITYQDPEWQAKALAGELMCAAHLILDMTPDEIAKKCGVSLDAAKYQLKKARGDVYCSY